MAKSSKTIVGLDIDPSGVTAAQVAVNGHVLIEAAATAPLEAGVVRDGEVEDVEALAEVLRSLFREHRDLDKRVRVGIANSKIVVRVIDLPPITDPKELEAAVRFQAQEHIPMPLDSAVLDFQPLEIVETEAGPRRRVLLVAARRDMIDRVLAAVRGAGLRVEGVDLAAFAMVRALYRKGDAEERILYLSVAGMTNLAMAQGSTCLFTRSSGGGLESLAVELAERRALTLEHARAWLVHVGVDRPVELIDGEEDIVTEAREVLVEGVRRIASEVRASLDFHHAQGGGGVMSRVVLTGPAIAVPGFAEALGIELGLPVEAGRLAGGPDDLEPGRLTVAAGLAIEEAPHS